MAVKPFQISLSDDKLSWITERVKSGLIIPDVSHPEGKEWDHGVPALQLKDIVDYWRTSYDWRKVEKKLNETFQMFLVNIEEEDEKLDVHFVHHRSKRADAIPLLFVHGWPGSFLEVEGLLSRLVDPEDPKSQAFHIVAPSIPGFAFSSPASRAGFTIKSIASVFKKLMSDILGYASFIAQGGDWGAGIVRCLAAEYPTICLGAHINFVQAFGPPSPTQNPLVFLYVVLGWFTPDEKRRMARMQNWFKEELGYAFIQGTKPQTISYALLDSPIGMLAWIYDKLHILVGPEFVWEKEVVITWAMIYLISENAGHARLYKENMQAAGKTSVVGKEVPFGVSAFAYDTAFIPKWWAQASVAKNITMWKEHPDGGHYPTLECPDVFARDIGKFVDSISVAQRTVLTEAGRIVSRTDLM